MAADSRTTFMGGDGKPFGYLDRMPKISSRGARLLGFRAFSSLEGELFSSFLKRNDYLLARPVNEILFDFLLRMPWVNTGETIMIAAGFIANKTSALLQQKLLGLGRLPTSAEAAAALTAAIEEHAKTDLSVGGADQYRQTDQSRPAAVVGRHRD
jgi:hypothetical protein